MYIQKEQDENRWCRNENFIELIILTGVYKYKNVLQIWRKKIVFFLTRLWDVKVFNVIAFWQHKCNMDSFRIIHKGWWADSCFQMTIPILGKYEIKIWVY